MSAAFEEWAITKFLSFDARKKRIAELRKMADEMEFELDNDLRNLIGNVSPEEETELRGIPARLAGGGQLVWILRGHNNKFTKQYTLEELQLLIDYYAKR